MDGVAGLEDGFVCFVTDGDAVIVVVGGGLMKDWPFLGKGSDLGGDVKTLSSFVPVVVFGGVTIVGIGLGSSFLGSSFLGSSFFGSSFLGSSFFGSSFLGSSLTREGEEDRIGLEKSVVALGISLKIQKRNHFDTFGFYRRRLGRFGSRGRW